MRLATWNINSVRLRMDLLLRLIEEEAPDVVCLQETKVPDGSFPYGPLAERGFVHTAIAGMKSYNGVAILSRIPLASAAQPNWCERTDCRHVSAVLANGVEVHSLYVPAGGDEPDPVVNDKFAHKLRFLDELTAWMPGAIAPDRPVVLAGDLNIAPLESDVWNHRALLDVVSHTPVEVERLGAMQASVGWVDAVRRFVPEPERVYTWWSYRASDWEASDRGRRLDHVWVTPALAHALKGHKVLRAARGWAPKPSDHVPVIVDIG
ncbi:MAG: exodeoxyribonuclease III [Rhodospirillales bacterium]